MTANYKASRISAERAVKNRFTLQPADVNKYYETTASQSQSFKHIHTQVGTGWSRRGVVGLYFYIYLHYAKPLELVAGCNNVTLKMLRP
jgi:hypothetical protein